MNVKVGLDDLADQGAEAAAFLVGVLVADVEIRPLPARVEIVEGSESLTAMEREDAIGLPGDHGQDRTLLRREVVVQLRPAGAVRATELVVVRRADTLPVDEYRGMLQDRRASPDPCP
ncbi:hypothetical protein ACWDSD_18425 [Streptomyces spiralis]